jgi:hypothetical protein
MPGEYCPHCRSVHGTVEETERVRAEMRALDAAIEWVCWIGMASIALAVLLWGLLA